MVRPGGWVRGACALVLLLAAHCDGKGMGMGMGMGMGSEIEHVYVPPQPRTPEKEIRCEVTVRTGGDSKHHVHHLVDDGHDTLEIKGSNCKFVGDAPSGSALVCFLYSALIIMPVMFYLSMHVGTSDYTWCFLDSFMGIFIAILWWSCFEESFKELDFAHRVGIYVIVRGVATPGVLYLIADHEYLYGVANILKHVVAFIAVSTGTEALKFGSGGEPATRLFGICLGVVGLNFGIWKLKNLLVENVLKEEKPDPSLARKVDRWDEVATEVGMDVTAICFAAMFFLSANVLYFRKYGLLQADADLSMGNTSLFDHDEEGEFAACFSFVMFVVTIMMEHFGGPEHEHPDEGAEKGEFKVAEVVQCKRSGKVNKQEVQLWERVVVLTNTPATAMTVLQVENSAFDSDRVDRTKVRKADLQAVEEEQWDVYLWHTMQLGFMAAASWSGLLAMSFLVRQLWFPSLLERHLEGSLLVSVILLFVSGFVILGLSAHAAGQYKFLSSKIMKYFRVYFLRALSLMAALSWDMTFDAAVGELPIEEFVPEDRTFVCKFFVASLMTFFIAPIYVMGMRPNMHAAAVLLEHKEKAEMHEHND